MAGTSRDLWPEIATTQTLTTPLTILKEQAAALAKKTNGLLEARVDTQSYAGGGFVHSFKIVAPALDNYVYELFKVRHSVLLYPVEVSADATGSSLPPSIRLSLHKGANTEDEFLEQLKVVLSSDQTSKVISALLAQVQA
jgi:hypothetical protein